MKQFIADHFPLLIIAAVVAAFALLIGGAIIWSSRWESLCHAAGGWSPNIHGNLCIRDGLIIDVYKSRP